MLLLLKTLPAHFAAIALLAALLGAVMAAPITAQAEEPATPFLAGADCSHVGFFEAQGKAYSQDGHVSDPFVLLKRDGINCVRLRLFYRQRRVRKAGFL